MMMVMMMMMMMMMTSRDYETVGITYIRYSSIGILILGRSHVK